MKSVKYGVDKILVKIHSERYNRLSLVLAKRRDKYNHENFHILFDTGLIVVLTQTKKWCTEAVTIEDVRNGNKQYQF